MMSPTDARAAELRRWLDSVTTPEALKAAGTHKLLELPTDLIERLLDTVKPPEHLRPASRMLLQYLFSVAHTFHELGDENQAKARKNRRAKEAKAREKLKKLAKQVAVFRQGLVDLEEAARPYLCTSLLRRRRYGAIPDREVPLFEMEGVKVAIVVPGDNTFERLCSDISEIEEIIRVASAEMQKDCKAGATRKTPVPRTDDPATPRRDEIGEAPNFETWICALYRLGEGQFGWSLSVHVENGSGNLVKFLDLARPHLPHGFVPPALSFKGLQNLRKPAGLTRNSVRSARASRRRRHDASSPRR